MQTKLDPNTDPNASSAFPIASCQACRLKCCLNAPPSRSFRGGRDSFHGDVSLSSSDIPGPHSPIDSCLRREQFLWGAIMHVDLGEYKLHYSFFCRFWQGLCNWPSSGIINSCNNPMIFLFSLW